MAKLAITPPSVGEKDSVAEPKVGTALQAVETWANGNVGANNIEAKGITEAMLATVLVEKLTTKLGMTTEAKNESLTGVSEKLYIMEKEASTLTLPAPTLNRVIGITCANSINAVKITCSEGKVFSKLHPAGATTVEVTTSSGIVVEATGSNWFVIAGGEKATDISGARTARVVGTEYEPSATRPTQVIVTIELGAAAVGEVLVGGVQVSLLKNANVAAIVIPITFVCPPAVLWKVVQGSGTITIASSYLLL